MDLLIQARKPDQVLINRKKKKKKKKKIRKRENEDLLSSGFCRSSGPLNENKRMRKDIPIFGPCQGIKKAIEHEGNGSKNCNWCTLNGPQKIRFGSVV